MVMILFTVVNFTVTLANEREAAMSELQGNPFRSLADVAFQSVGLQWGWVVVLIGSALLLAVASWEHLVKLRDGIDDS